MINNGIQGRIKKAVPQALGEMFMIHQFHYHKNVVWESTNANEKVVLMHFCLTQVPLLIAMKAVKSSFKPKPLISFNSS